MQDPLLPDCLLRREAFDLMSALDAYDLASARLLETWLDMEVYADFGRQIDAIRAHGVCVPALTVLSLQLVIAHAELVSTMWQHSAVRVAPAQLQEVRERHALAVSALRGAAARLLRGD